MSSTSSGIAFTVGAELDVQLTIGGPGGAGSTSIVGIASGVDGNGAMVPGLTAHVAAVQMGPVAAITSALNALRGASRTTTTVARNAANIASLTTSFATDGTVLATQTSATVAHTATLAALNMQQPALNYSVFSTATLTASQSQLTLGQFNTEVARAVSADAGIAAAVAAETQRAQLAEAVIQGAISSASSAFVPCTQLYPTLNVTATAFAATQPAATSQAVAVEAVRATGAEGTINAIAAAVASNINAETARAQTSESYLAGNLTAYFYNASAINAMLSTQVQLIHAWTNCEASALLYVHGNCV